ncbi:hypothetical protein [Haloterrigena alkaliphila]|uniref:Uncharacterized protein n=1 Tax=Haloterrigena alkaliphila TaxID=2816475 RepID=A0A8A2VFH6_9EURY|nr:hypothetical protein [Haloterrigena alkaliphila]QSW99154.1 hypothetical protein J0X25_17520 [Haloterrigena alkaliphila]
MRFKPVPEPPNDLASVGAILEAVPATAGAVDDCCAHLVAETRLEDRSEAETWLVFLRALELVSAESAGYCRLPAARSDESPTLDPTDSGRAFRERVDGAEAVLESLESAGEPLSAAAVADELAADHAASGRENRPARFEVDRVERVRRLLEWAVLLERVERTGDGDRYRPAALE